ncbi:MAG: AAA family ATPase [Nanobdellota archaeon]
MVRFKWVRDSRDDNILLRFGSEKKKQESSANHGWKKDPFRKEVSPVEHFFVGRHEERRKIKDSIGQNLVIKGRKGAGKTFLLKWLEGYLLKKGFFVSFMSAKESKYENFQKDLLASFSKVHKKVFGSTEKKLRRLVGKTENACILVDDADHLTKKNLSLLSSLDADIISTVSKGKSDLELGKMSFDEIYDMVFRRIEDAGGKGIEPFTEVQLRSISEKAGYNPGKVLKYCAHGAHEDDEIRTEYEGDRIVREILEQESSGL